MRLPSFLKHGKVCIADLDPSIVAKVDDETFSIDYLDLWEKLSSTTVKKGRAQIVEHLGRAIGWHLVARQALKEGFVCSDNLSYRNAQKLGPL